MFNIHMTPMNVKDKRNSTHRKQTRTRSRMVFFSPHSINTWSNILNKFKDFNKTNRLNETKVETDMHGFKNEILRQQKHI